MDIGRKIYYELNTGNVILLTESRSGSVIETTIEQDFQNYLALHSYQQSAVGIIQLNYGDFEANFAKYPFHIDITKNPIDEIAIVWDIANPIGATLADVQASKIAQVQDLYNQKLENGFTSALNGTTYTFRYGQSDQLKFVKLMIGVNGGLLQFPVNIPDINGTIVVYNTQTDLQQLLKDLSVFDNTTQTELHTLMSQVQACTTVDAVNAIQINF
jgi:uncharacterized protein (DUF697 family)